MQEVEAGARAYARRSSRVYRGRVEVELEAPARPARYARLRANLSDPRCILLLVGACLAQAADAITTAVGLQRAGRYEANVLMHDAVTQPVTSGLLKVMLVLLVSGLALLRLPTRQARFALFIALALSAIAPIQNTFQIFGS